MNHDDLFDLIPAYALGALDPDEQARFEAWLDGHPEAQMLLADYRQVAGHLAALAPMQPAPERLQADLRQRLVADRAARQPPAVPASHEASGRVLRLHRRWQRLALLAAAVLLVIVIGVVLVRPASAPAEEAAEAYARIAAVDNAGWYDVVPGDVTASVTGDLVSSPDGDEAVIKVAQLPAIGDDQTFQLWLVDHDGNRVSGGLFRPEQADATFVRVPLEQPITQYQAFGVSLEPEGGSPFADQPTGPRVFSIPLNS